MVARLTPALVLVWSLGLGCAWAVAADAPATSAPVTTSGVVVYSDPEWGRLFLYDGGRVLPAAGEALPSFPELRRLVEISGRQLRDLGPAPLPEAVPIDRLPPRDLRPRWTALEGTVRSIVGAETTRSFLRVAFRGTLLDVHLPSAWAPGAGPHVGASMRLAGVLESPADPWLPPRLWVPHWSQAVLTAPAPSWADVRTVTVARARELASAGLDHEVRLMVRASARESTRSFRVADDREAITADLARPDLVREGDTLEIRGFPVLRRGAPVLADARWRAGGGAGFARSRREPGLATLTQVAAVRALSRAEAERGHPVRVEGVATYLSVADHQLFVQDETGGLYVRLEGDLPGISAGDRVRVEGFTAPGLLAPLVTSPSVRRLGAGRLPAALPVSSARLAAGYDDCRRIETSGVVRRSWREEGRTEVLLGIEGRQVLLHLPMELPAAAFPADARVRVRAVCGTRFNWRSLFDHVELFAPSVEDVVVEEQPGPPFALPLVSVRDVLRTGAGGRWDRLVRTRGVVLYRSEGGPLYVRAATGTLIARTESAQPAAPGDVVDLVGFPVPGRATPRLEQASFLRLAQAPPPAPVVVSGGHRLGLALDGELTRFPATLLRAVQHRSGTSLILQAADTVIDARGDGDFADVPPQGSLLEVTGILLAEEDAGGDAPALRVVLRDPADVRVLARPAWLTRRRAAWLMAGFAASALLALAWVVTLRRRVRVRTAELQATERRYRLLADNASDVIVTTDKALRLTYVSPSVTRDSGYSIDEALATPLERAFAPESWDRLRSAIGQAGAGQGPVDLELELLRKDGSSRWMHVRTGVLRDENGRHTGFLASARDVTARRQARQEVARLAAAIGQSADTVVLTAPDGTILYVNPAFERTTGYSAAEVLGGTPALLKSGVHDRAFYDAMWATLQEGNTWEGRFTNRRKDGQLFLEDATISPVRDAGGGLIGYVAVKRDVTRQVQLEEQFAQTRKMEALGRLAAGIAHDFNNLLAIMLNLADLALLKGSSDERIGTCINGIREAALRAGGLTRQILTFSRRSPAQLEPVDARQVVGEAVGMLRLLLPTGVEVRERLESTALVAADATQLQQLVVNLGTNAGLALRDGGGAVEVALEDVEVDAGFAESHRPLRPGPCLRLVVRDRGCGMTPEVMARIFEPFFTTRASAGGTGMGLAVVHGIVHNHHGAISVESEPRKGSTFSVYLPALAAHAGVDAQATTRSVS